MSRKTLKKRLGIIGGLGVLAGADVYFKLAQAIAKSGRAESYEVMFEQQSFGGDTNPDGGAAALNRRKLYIYDIMKQFEARKVDSVLVPCFVSHTFIKELQAELTAPVVNIMDALLAHLDRSVSGSCKIGILTSDFVRKKQLFENHFDPQKYTLLYPHADIQEACVMQAIYGEKGIKAGNLHEGAVDLLHRACADLYTQGADVIVAGATELAVVSDALQRRGVPIIDTNQVYADYALSHELAEHPREFKIGIIGGVGPAATVDFMEKIIRNTEARRDQDHIKLIVEHNPKIPDRTANLIGDGEDPTIAIYSACKRLEANDADLIAIPCNTAHAYVERIQPFLGIPIVNMLFETVSHIRKHYGDRTRVGLLATSGTVASGVYHEAAAGAHFELLVPDHEHQQKLMHAIYGERGVKAGFLEGECKEDFMQAFTHLVERGATVIILGCTELPLLQSATTDFAIAGKSVVVLDPTDILARRCISYRKSGAACN